MTREAFDAVVARTLAEVPEPFRSRLAEIAVTVADRPTREELRDAGVRRGSLFGLFQGRALTEQSEFDLPAPPPRIVLYRAELEEEFPDRAELESEIRKTLLHELGHFFGLSERDLGRLGYR